MKLCFIYFVGVFLVEELGKGIIDFFYLVLGKTWLF